MKTDPITRLASAIVIGMGVVWGLYWVPVRQLAEIGLPGAWGTVAITCAAVVMLAPFALWNLRSFGRADPWAMAFVALGGAAFALYSIGFVYGRVAIIILLFYLTPVWSTLIGRYVRGWHTPPMRIWAIVVGLLGLGIMLSANGDAPIPRNIGEWMALASGILWSVATTGIHSKPEVEPGIAAFVFALGASATVLVLAPVLEPFPYEAGVESIARVSGWAMATGSLWWGFSMVGLMWATARLEPARVGILLMTEVLVGVVSAAVLAGEHLDRLELMGGAFVLCAGVLEVWPVRRRAPD